jgi:hypothetical protein
MAAAGLIDKLLDQAFAETRNKLALLTDAIDKK